MAASGNCAPEQLTKTDTVEFDPVIDDTGSVAWAQMNSDSSSTVVIDGEALDLPQGLYKGLAYDQDTLYVGQQLASADKWQLMVINRSSRQYDTVSCPLLIDRITVRSDNRVVLEGLDSATNHMAIYDYHTDSKALVRLQDNAVYGIDEQLITLKGLSSDDSLKQLIQRDIDSDDPLLSYSSANNAAGRLSYYASYRLLGMLDAWQHGGIPGLSQATLKALITHAAAKMISNAKDYGWPTTKYSLDQHTELSLLVNDACVLYPLLKAYNAGLLDDQSGRRLLEIAKTIWDRNESDWIQGQGYRFTPGIAYIWDGVTLPFNQQNAFGLALLELHTATGDQKYLDRALDLAKLFKSEMVQSDDGRLLWHYWPQRFYDGWTISSGVSVNTPERKPTQDTLFEDVSHSAWNVMFMVELQKNQTIVFTGQDYSALDKTLTGIKDGVSFNRFLGGSLPNQTPSLQYRPSYGWLFLGNDDLRSDYATRVITTTIPYDGDRLANLIYALNHD
ncbi:MAG: hypothetical protein FWF25_00660 [Propionibacteriaceae bacterium]|nr:hypothetical protein [Propionibacteriaceae bacterium]